MDDPESILGFWLEEVGENGWYSGGKELDASIREHFGMDWCRVMDGGFRDWLASARGTLAYLILTDQFPRNMFRNTAKAFASDRIALSAAKSVIKKGLDRRICGMVRQFVYLPLMHSECLPDQDRCVRLLKERMPDGGSENLVHARAHREIIRCFGRFPTRNAALARPSSALEVAHLDGGGYGGVLEMVRSAR